MKSIYKKIAVKIGSNVLSAQGGLPQIERMEHLAAQIAFCKKQGIEIILVSSGAVAFGRGMVHLSDNIDTVQRRQVLASIGQVRLIQTWVELFEKHNIKCAQVLVTKEDFRDRRHYLNMRSCIDALTDHDILPIINENDVVSVTELMFTDNDELVGLLGGMLNVDGVIILSNIDGIYKGNPNDPGAELIQEIDHKTNDLSSYISTSKSNFGRGGMLTKSNIALKLSKMGIHVHIANGHTQHILTSILEGKQVGTHFIPKNTISNKKKWIAYSESMAKGTIKINAGAADALQAEKAHSLLPIGITQVEGSFKKGDIVRIEDEKGVCIGFGTSEYSSQKAVELIGKKQQKPIVHYDYLFIK
jgi:glutamate 5-kinase